MLYSRLLNPSLRNIRTHVFDVQTIKKCHSAHPDYLGAHSTVRARESCRYLPPLVLRCFSFCASCVSWVVSSGYFSFCFLLGDGTLLFRVAWSFASATHRPWLLWGRHGVIRNVKRGFRFRVGTRVLTVHKWCSTPPQRALPKVSLLAAHCSQKEIDVPEASIYCRNKPSKLSGVFASWDGECET